MRIVICAKEVLDPDAVNAYAVAGRLTIGDDGKTIAQTAVPRLMNAYDEQAIEAALRLKDDGHDVTITVVAVGPENVEHLKRAAALGVDETVIIPVDPAKLDTLAVGKVLAKYVESTGGADLVLCGRQASDDDQGVVPPVVAERLGLPLVTMARDVKVEGSELRVVRVSAAGDELVACDLPAVVTISSELGDPRFPTAAGMMRARKMAPTKVSLGDIGLSEADIQPHVVLQTMAVPQHIANCDFIPADNPDEAAAQLLAKLRADGVLN